MILGGNLLKELGLDLKLSEHVIVADYGPFKGYTIPMVDLDKYLFKALNTEKIHLNNFLPILTSNRYIIQNIYVLQLNYYVQY